MNNVKKGKRGEDLACNYLISKGYEIIERNFFVKTGEIDLIAIKDDVIIFIEVKSRSNCNYGYPYEAVNSHKRNKIINTSLHYMRIKNLTNYQMRFDIIEVYFNENDRINHIKNVFY